MGRTLEEVLNSLSPERRARVEKRTAALEAEYEAMQHLKKLIDMAGSEVDRELVNTPELISQLRDYVETLGGSLDITINLPGVLHQFAYRLLFWLFKGFIFRVDKDIIFRV